MRTQLNKLVRHKSTKAERRFAEILKSQRIPFKTKFLIQGREVDFLVGTYAIEVDSHPQDSEKNNLIIQAGYTPYHLHSWEVGPHLTDWIQKINGRHISLGSASNNREPQRYPHGYRSK